MKIQCNVCGESEAMVVCCADEAALCVACDEKVHRANKLASKHQRVSLYNSSSQMPNCDICQEMAGYFFCLEDRALLCRKCDLAIHTVNAHVSAHQRFLLTGAKVGLQPLGSTFPSAKPRSGVNISNISSTKSSASTGTNPMTARDESLHDQISEIECFGQAKQVSFANGASDLANIAQWQLNDFFGMPEFNQSYDSLNHGKSEGDSIVLGDSSTVDEVGINDCFGQVPETYWTVPQIPSESGHFRPRRPNFSSDPAMFVPCSSLQNTQCMILKKSRR